MADILFFFFEKNLSSRCMSCLSGQGRLDSRMRRHDHDVFLVHLES